jgi:hypothetical protein
MQKARDEVRSITQRNNDAGYLGSLSRSPSNTSEAGPHGSYNIRDPTPLDISKCFPHS